MKLKFFKILLWKAYFDKGFSLLNYFKYIIAIIGVKVLFEGIALFWIFVLAFVYAVLCLILGRLWFHFHLIDTEHEINNIFNPFCKDVRNSISVNRK